MKNKDFTQNNPWNIPRFISMTVTVFLIAVLFISLSVKVLGNNTFRVENCNKCEEYSQQLGKEINDFIALDTEPTKTVSTQVTAAINEYRKEMIDIQSHPDIEKRSLENEIILAYTKGNAAGRIAWVYYYNIYTFDSSISTDKITSKYISCQSRISSATQHTVLSAECNVMLDELNRLIYTERAKNLALPQDSLTASSLISGAIESFKTISSPDIFGESYALEYNKLTKELGLQRVRDALKKEAEQVFESIRPSESFSSSATASLLIYELQNAEAVKSMNSATVDFIEELLAIDEKKPYSAIAKKEYLSQSQNAASRATENQTAAKLTEIFKGYALAIKKADIKDSVYALFLGNGSNPDQKLSELEQSFNREGGIIDSCKNDLEVEAELINAKSALFIYKHENILNKSFEELSQADEEAAKNALVEYVTLEESVKKKLFNEINIIAEKYNNILIIKIRSFLIDDALYLDFCETISNEIKSVSRENIEDFYNKVTRIPQKAEALSKVIQEYRSILASENFKGYEQSEKEALLSVLSELSRLLNETDPADIAIYHDEILDSQTSAIRKLNVIDQSARVRIATRSSKNAEVLNELKAAREKIALCSEKSEMSLQANRAIYKIERLLTSDAIANSCSALKSAISSMKFLNDNEKKNFTAKISSLESKSKDAKEAENITVLENIWTSFSESINSVRSEAEAIDLSRAIGEYLKKVDDASKSKLNVLTSLKYISKEKSDEIYNKINLEQGNTKQQIPLCKSTAEVLNRYSEFLKILDNILILANKEDLNGYKLFLMLEFDEYDKIKANYSEENYNKILSIKEDTHEKLITATTKSECDSLLKVAHNEILLINDLLDDEKETALASLLALLESLKKDSPLYSVASFSKIEGLYDEAKIEIGKINDISNIASVKQTLSKYMFLIKDVRKDSLYTSTEAHSIATPELQYPNDYDYSKGLLGSIHLSNGLVSDAKFSIKLLDESRNKQIEELIRKSAKKHSLLTSKELSEQTLKLLRSAAIGATIDISLSSVIDEASEYTVQILIPNNLCNENILGLAFVKDDKVEFYPINQADSLISVKLDHFSKYYIIVESTLNVKPLLIALIILLIIEFLVLIGIIYLRYRRKTEDTDKVQSNLPNLPMSALFPFAPTLARIYPENGLSLAILLSIAAIALAATIALLIRSEAKVKKVKETQKQLKGRKEQLLLGKGEKTEDIESSFLSVNDSEEFCIVGASLKSTISKTEIDLDVIADNFKAGELVNLQALKKKGLVDESTEYIKILTKGNLTKPLTVEANEFSNAAKDILELSGGEAKEITD